MGSDTRPCPFCGSANVAVDYGAGIATGCAQPCYVVRCLGCLAQTRHFLIEWDNAMTREQIEQMGARTRLCALAAWNQRVTGATEGITVTVGPVTGGGGIG